MDWDFLDRVMMKKDLVINGECGCRDALETLSYSHQWSSPKRGDSSIEGP